ncbi:hypothetical protein J3R74_003785 [Puniceicoccus vermicola]
MNQPRIGYIRVAAPFAHALRTAPPREVYGLTVNGLSSGFAPVVTGNPLIRGKGCAYLLIHSHY